MEIFYVIFLKPPTTFMETGGSNEFDIIALIKRN